ncbi:formylglycine-generating enzyme family protein [bacterium]|nr:formylglycine-generating enzyme family protein [bacterium]MBU1676435.1 formylglycine-generating enzyme family protein [bacterium]
MKFMMGEQAVKNHPHRELLFLLAVGCLVFPVAALADMPPEVMNVLENQRPGTYLVDISCDLFDADGDLMFVTAYLSVDGGSTFPIEYVSVTGDAGAFMVSGDGLAMTWDAGADYLGYYETQCVIRVVAEDGFPIPEGCVYIHRGTFEMGSPETEVEREADELQHTVTLTRSFFMQATEVTQAEYVALMGVNPSVHQGGPECPVDSVTVQDALIYCNAKSLEDGLTPAYEVGIFGTWHQEADGWRLPTEANFRGDFYPYPGCPVGIHRYAPISVANFPPNAWGLYDMHGNVFEWCWDYYLPDYYADDQIDPTGPELASTRCMRGGCYASFAQDCRSAERIATFLDHTTDHHGFRIVRWAY